MKRRTLVAAAGSLAIAGSIPLSALAAEKTIVVGVTAGPHAEIMEVVKRIAEKQGMKIRIVEFNDFVQPNAALVAGDLDINSFQHKPYMDQQNEDRGYKLASAAPPSRSRSPTTPARATRPLRTFPRAPASAFRTIRRTPTAPCTCSRNRDS